MNRRSLLALAFGLIPKRSEQQKFIITGLAHSETSNDCTIPPIITYGTDRVDALLHCCSDGELTVWTESEWNEAQSRIGKKFQNTCEEVRRKLVNKEPK